MSTNANSRHHRHQHQQHQGQQRQEGHRDIENNRDNKDNKDNKDNSDKTEKDKKNKKMAVYPSQSIQDTHDAQKDSAKGADQKPEFYGRMGKEHERTETNPVKREDSICFMVLPKDIHWSNNLLYEMSHFCTLK